MRRKMLNLSTSCASRLVRSRRRADSPNDMRFRAEGQARRKGGDGGRGVGEPRQVCSVGFSSLGARRGFEHRARTVGGHAGREALGMGLVVGRGAGGGVSIPGGGSAGSVGMGRVGKVVGLKAGNEVGAVVCGGPRWGTRGGGVEGRPRCHRIRPETSESVMLHCHSQATFPLRAVRLLREPLVC